jgi:hypothetical protein
MKRIILITITLTFSLLIYSCYYDSEEALYPSLDTTCDTNNVTFSVSITTMLSENCLSCHSNSTAAASGGNIRLQDYADVAAQSTSLANAIQHTGGVTPMPKNGGKVSDCGINQFSIWIRQGKQNN